MSYTPVEFIEVWMWGQRVGVLAQNPATHHHAFEYDLDWVAAGVEIAPLHMPVGAGVYEFGGLPETFRRLPPAISDALPDRFGNALIDRWLAREQIDQASFTVLDRLAYVADRAMGALEFRPPIGADAPITSAVQLADLVLAARRSLDPSDEPVDASALEQLIQVGSSAGGARPKALVSFDAETYRIRSAWADPAPGFDQWLVKLDGATTRQSLDGRPADTLGGSAPFGAIEYAYSLMARAAGIEMTETLLLHEGNRRHFMTRRFDRSSDGAKHHVISLCGIEHLDFNLIGAHGYDQLFAVIDQLGLDVEARAEAFRRMVFNVAAANHDDHTRNLAFLRRQHGPFELAPAFDITYAYDADNQWLRQHLMSVNGRVTGIERTDLHEVGERWDVPAYKRLVDSVFEAVDAWPTFAGEADLDDDTVAQVAATLDAVRPT